MCNMLLFWTIFCYTSISVEVFNNFKKKKEKSFLFLSIYFKEQYILMKYFKYPIRYTIRSTHPKIWTWSTPCRGRWFGRTAWRTGCVRAWVCLGPKIWSSLFAWRSAGHDLTPIFSVPWHLLNTYQRDIRFPMAANKILSMNYIFTASKSVQGLW